MINVNDILVKLINNKGTVDWSDKINVYNIYHALNSADAYIIGLIDEKNNTINAYRVDKINTEWLKFDVTSKNSQGISFKKLTFRPCKKQIVDFINNNNNKLIGTWNFSEYENIRLSQNFSNRGEFFEKMIIESLGKTWRRTNVPFDVDSDLEFNGIKYQIKFLKAEICNENNLQNAVKRFIEKNTL